MGAEQQPSGNELIAMRKMTGMGLFATSLIVCSAAFGASPQSEGFRQLTGPQITQALVGRTFSDDIHFSFRYRPKGVIEGMSMGRKVTDKWVIQGNRLCVTDSFGQSCYVVWKKGAAVKLVVEGTEVILDGFVR
ncbi:hypothetical protein QM467_00030 [Rhodoblastus sp. 17X3]|uniref:hypothetical protein n=1 Tax=Rhodoblastus sp. 17X3 TaxID=3047026 RepID=UPI0024B63C10|nr:hypothetical protein [Rhodoblastus sp. 17X3]MDI9846438.1 hypothetical protein [Rhodoblastus sp. 17X3]